MLRANERFNLLPQFPALSKLLPTGNWAFLCPSQNQAIRSRQTSQLKYRAS